MKTLPHGQLWKIGVSCKRNVRQGKGYKLLTMEVDQDPLAEDPNKGEGQ